MDNIKVVVIKDEDRLTRNTVSHYELASSVSVIMKIIQSTSVADIPSNLLKEHTSNISEVKKKNISNDQIINEFNETYVKLSSTSDIARACINKKIWDLKLYRPIQEDKKNNILYVEEINFNDLDKPFLDYFNNANI